MKTETIAALVLLAAMGCLALSIYKVKEWYRKNTRTADPHACEQEKVNLKMMEQVRRREQVLKPEPPPDGYTEIAAPFGGHGLLDLKNMLLAVLLFVFYGLAVEYTGTHPFLDGGEKLFIVFLLTVLTCCAAIRIYRRVYFGYRIYLPEDSTGMVVYNWYWGRRFFSLYRIPPYRGCVSVCSVDRYEVRDDEIRIYGKFVHTGTDVTIQGFNDKGLPVGRFFGEEEEKQILNRLEAMRKTGTGSEI